MTLEEEIFKKIDLPHFGPKINIDFDKIKYYKNDYDLGIKDDWININKNIKEELSIYDFKIMTFEELEQWIKENNALRIENNKEYERRKQHLTKLAIISKLYFLD